MAETTRRKGDQGDADQGFLRRWSRRKAAARSPATSLVEDAATAAEHAPASAEQTAEGARGAPAPVDASDLPDIDSLDANSDFTLFMRPGVPEHLRTLALRKLWRSDPIFSKLDGLLEYGGDYTIPSWPKGAVATAYRIGRGFVNEIEKLGGDEAQAETPEARVSAPAREAAPAVASAEPMPAADMPGDTPQPAATTGSGAAEATSPSAPAGVTAKRRARPLPRRG